MTIQMMDATTLLAVDKIVIDEENPHIRIDRDICRKCAEKPCLYVCPAALYTLDADGDVSYDYAGCLECGTCRLVCMPKGIIQWTYPRAPFGIHYRHG